MKTGTLWVCLAAFAACGNPGTGVETDATVDVPQFDVTDAGDVRDDGGPFADADAAGDPGPGTDPGVVADGETTPDGGIRTPDLAPVTAQQASELLAHVRGIRTEAAGSVPVPVAWSFVNWNCQERALVLQYAIATADPALQGDPQTMREADLTPDHLAALAQAPVFGVAALNVTGPLAAEQTFLKPDLEEVPGPPYRVFWTYHHTAALNVDGVFMAADLSIGDAPIPIDEWVRAFVPADIACPHLGADAWWDAWVYWNALANGYEPPPEPAFLCGYTITPMFTTKWDQDIQSDQVRWSPATMASQLGGFQTVLQGDYGYTPSDDEIPYITSRYAARTLAEVCTWNDYGFCDDL